MKIFILFFALALLCFFLYLISPDFRSWFHVTLYVHRRRRAMRIIPNVEIKPGAWVWSPADIFIHGPLQVKEVIPSPGDVPMAVSLRGDFGRFPLVDQLRVVIPGECLWHRFIDYEVNDFNKNAGDTLCINCGTYVEKIMKDHPNIRFRYDAELTEAQRAAIAANAQDAPLTGVIYRLISV